MWKKTKDMWRSLKNFIKKQNKNTVIGTIAIIVLVVIGGVYYFKTNPNANWKFWEIGDNKVAEKAVSYINDNGLASSEASLVSVSRESGLIKIVIKIGSTEYDSYVSRDGKYLFPSAIEIIEAEEIEGEGSVSTTSAASCDDLTKTDSPMLEVYVVSQCPYGLQIQRAMAEAVANSPELANYIKARYIGAVSGNTISSMHGEVEATENLRQICIREEQSTKYWTYTSCYIKAGDSAGCLSSTGVDSSTLSACMSDISRGVAYASEDFILADAYGISGSPTLMLGDADVNETGFGGRSADAIKEIVCCASISEPSFCSQTLNTNSAATSFSETYSSSGGTTTASCE